jgi:DNA-directed RNA polymerase subunit K/omega
VDQYLKELEKMKINRYKQVIVASKYARLLNARFNKQRHDQQSEEGEEKSAPQLYRRVAAEALQALLDGKIEYEEPGEKRSSQ